MNVLVLPEAGTEHHAADWTSAGRQQGMDLAVTVVPGDGAGASNVLDPIFNVARSLIDTPEARFDLVIAIGSSSWSGQVLAMAQRCDQLLLVDGSNGPFLTAAERAARRTEVLRARLYTDQLQPSRALHDWDIVAEAAAAISIPVVLAETDHSPIDHKTAGRWAATFVDATLCRVASGQPSDVLSTLG